MARSIARHRPLVGEVVQASPAEPCLSVAFELDVDEVGALTCGPVGIVATAGGA